eukprot:scaffold501_cov355-Pinguiococcus_pyrenoidosus.AAC.13
MVARSPSVNASWSASSICRLRAIAVVLWRRSNFPAHRALRALRDPWEGRVAREHRFPPLAPTAAAAPGPSLSPAPSPGSIQDVEARNPPRFLPFRWRPLPLAARSVLPGVKVEHRRLAGLVAWPLALGSTPAPSARKSAVRPAAVGPPLPPIL